ncbi:MAG: LytR/AlgR family response regulator transcription factor [Flavobacteriales bacterium]
MNEPIRAIVVDDETLARENLKMMLEEYCPEIEVVAAARNAKQAHSMVEDYAPDLVFLDIMMPGENGFSFLSEYEHRNFAVIFTTAHGEHALKALKAEAVDYLEKPLNVEEIQEAVDKAIAKIQLQKSVKNHDQKLQRLVDNLGNSKTSIPTSDGFVVVDSNDIIHMEADETYTMVYLTKNRKVFSSKSIKMFENKLDESTFMRIHRSFIINWSHHLREFKRTDGGIVILSDNTEIPISRRKLPVFLSRISNL